MGDDDRGCLYLRDTGWYQRANSLSGARLLDTLSTDLLEPACRFAFWSDVVCRTFTRLDCRAADRKGFRATLRSRSVAGISVARVEATPSGVVRTADLTLSALAEDFLQRLLTRSNEAELEFWFGRAYRVVK